MSLCLENSSISWLDSTINTLLSLNRNLQGIGASVRTTFAFKTKIELTRLEKSAVRSYRTSRFSFSVSTFLLSLKMPEGREVVHQGSCLSIKSSKEKTKTYPGQATFERYLFYGQAEIQVFFRSPTTL